MPLKSGELTRKEDDFVRAYFATGDRAAAERMAGYAPQGGFKVLARPEVQARIAQEQLGRLSGEALPVAISTLLEIMRNTKAPAAARVQASKIVLDRALPSDMDPEKRELTPEEIASAISALEARAAELAKPVAIAPDSDVFD